MTRRDTTILRHTPVNASTYTDQIRAIFPWDPEVAELFTRNGATSSRVRAVVRSDTGEILAGCGADYVPVPWGAVGAALDTIAAGLGIDPRLAPVKVATWNGGRRYSLAIMLSADAIAALRVPSDPSGRTVSAMLRGSHDLSLDMRLALAIGRLACTNGLVIGETLASLRAKHTSSVLARLADSVAGADRKILPAVVETGRTLRALAAHTLTRDDVVTIAGDLAGVDKEDPTARQIATRDRVIAMVRDADGVYVPRHDGPGDADALQLLEAATAIDRHGLSGDGARDPRAVLESRGMGSRAWSMLRALPGLPERIVAMA